jgi:hypothetical protein
MTTKIQTGISKLTLILTTETTKIYKPKGREVSYENLKESV